MRYSVVGILTLLILNSLSDGNSTVELVASEQDFDQHIAPILARRCSGCHNSSEPKGGLDLTRADGLRRGGDSGEVITPGDTSGSLLWKRVSTGEMPPKPKQELPSGELASLRRWIEQGARWGQKAIDPFEFSSDSRAGFDWWSLQPVQNSQPPSWMGVAEACGTIVDPYILTRLASVGQSPSPPASAAELIRRAYLDTLGLPPSPEAVDTFVADHRPDAFDRLVDQLLSSPHFGERWARHWLDIIRYGESQGFERDKLRTNAWRFRDWVIQALNDDMPYDSFVRWQLAGDVLAEGSGVEPQVATGFLVAGAYDEVGQQQQSAAMRAVVRQDEMEDLIAAVAQTFLGLTVNCARCHDHKFDPISQQEYYRLAASLGGVHHGDRQIQSGDMESTNERAAAGLRRRKEYLLQELDSIERPVRETILRERAESKVAASPPQPVAVWEFQDHLHDDSGKLTATASGNARIDSGKLILDGSSYVQSAPLGFDLKEKTLEVWAQLTDLNQRGGGVMTVQSRDGSVFDSIAYAEQEAALWLAGSNNFARTKAFQGPGERDALRRPVHFAISYHADGKIAAYRNGALYGTPYVSPGVATFKAGETVVLFGLRHSPPGGNRFIRGAILRACLYDRALTPLEVAASAGTTSDYVDDAEFSQRLTVTERQQRETLRFEVDQIQSQIDRWKEMKIYGVVPKTPAATFVLARGQPSKPGEEVVAGGLRALPIAGWDLPSHRDQGDEERRRRLTGWLANRNNPLFSRVIVNRIWQYHFGSGIVETTNDFGFNGTRPSHPELLDQLAISLWRYDGHLKPLHRQILLSGTYQQSSRQRPELLAIDSRNRMLWRMEPLRLEAEVIRDAMLSAAGELNPSFGGPGYYDFATHVHNTQFYEMRDPIGFSFNRRSVYRTWVRSGRSNFLDVFDCPDPSTKTPSRAVTTTPLQSLALLNSSFSLRMSQRFADRLILEFPNDTTAQIRQALRWSFGRPSDMVGSPAELSELEGFARQHGLAALCRVLFNSNEFLYSP